MAKTNTKKGISTKTSDKSVKILITTNEHLVSGNLFLPIPSAVENPTNENLLFYALNCGNKFIQLYDCTIQSKDSIEFQPEQVNCYNINLDIVHSCQIIDED